MDFLALFLVIFSAIFHAWWNFLAKGSQHKIAFLWLVTCASVALYTPFALFFIRHLGSADSRGWLFSFISAVLHFLYVILLGKSYEYGELSLVYPLARSAPLFVPFLAVPLLGEQLSLIGILGIILVMLGCYILHTESFSLVNLLEPIRSMKGVASRFAISTALVISFYSVNDKIGLRYMDPFYFLWTSSLMRIIMMVPYMLITPGWKVIREEWRINTKEVLISGALIFFAYFLVLVAMKTSKISYIVSVRQMSIIFAVLLGIIVLKERYGAIRLPASLVITSGVVLIGLA